MAARPTTIGRQMRYLITLSVEGLEAAADVTTAAVRYFEKHPDFLGKYEALVPEQQEVS
jgi:hypothetical protein